MTDALRLSFAVACSSEHAFMTWTARIGSWWPADHTVSRSEDAAVVLQAGVGGRIYERTVDGQEHDWGEITAWERLGDEADAWRDRNRIGWTTLMPHYLSAAQTGERP